MTARTSRQRGPRERGFALAIVAGGLTALVLLCAVAIDLGMGWLVRARINKAVDAAALIAVKFAARGLSEMQAAAVAVGRANYPGATFETTITDHDDLTVVRVEGQADVPTLFGRAVGAQSFKSASAAEVTRYPLDLSLVMDISRSISQAGAWNDLVDSADTFLDFFDEARDQVGVVTFATTAMEVLALQKNFKTGCHNTIDSLQPRNDTNIMDGILIGHQQLLAAPVRSANGPRRVVLVLFTDGRPNAFTGELTNIQPSPDASCSYGGTVPSFFGGLSAFMNGAPIRAITEPGQAGNERRIKCFRSDGSVDETTDAVQPPPWTAKPLRLPDGSNVTGDNLRAYASTLSLQEATSARQDHVTIYTIGLGNPNAARPEYVPDQDLLRRIANENGVESDTEPQGQMFFAPDRTTLQVMFEQVASRILTRLTL